jgi:hypothetical protein
MGVGVLDDDDFSDFEHQLESFRDFDKRRENFFTVSFNNAIMDLHVSTDFDEEYPSAIPRAKQEV